MSNGAIKIQFFPNSRLDFIELDFNPPLEPNLIILLILIHYSPSQLFPTTLFT